MPPSAPAPDLPAWCPPPLASACLGRASAPIGQHASLAAQVEAAAERGRSERFDGGPATLLYVHLEGREQSVGLALREVEGNEVLELLSLADAELDDRKVVAALATNGKPGLAGFVTLEIGGQSLLFARAANLAATLDDDELDRMIDATARLADEWEARQSQGADRW